MDKQTMTITREEALIMVMGLDTVMKFVNQGMTDENVKWTDDARNNMRTIYNTARSLTDKIGEIFDIDTEIPPGDINEFVIKKPE